MRLSEAIRLGSLLGPHLKDGWLIGPGNASCVMGAALLALGVDCTEVQNPDPEMFDTTQAALKQAMQVQSRLNDLLPLHFPGLQRQIDGIIPTSSGITPFVPQFAIVPKSLFTCLWQMNDRTHLTREQIADWIVNNGYDCDSVDLQPQEELHECQDSPVTA